MAVAALLVLAGCGEHEPDDRDAYKACENWVGERLRAPSTADFSGYSDSEIVTDGSDSYVITGHVDAENGFGANIRTDWRCRVELAGDNWRLLALDL